MTKKTWHIGALIALVSLAIIVFTACNQSEPVIAHDWDGGKSLSLTYCQGCHKYPDANLIDKRHWERRVLPVMGAKLGLVYWGSGYTTGRKNAISLSDWNKIVAWYKYAAPDKINVPSDQKLLKDQAFFKLIIPRAIVGPATTTMLKFDSASRRLYSADATNSLFQWSNFLKPVMLIKLASPCTDIAFTAQQTLVLTCIGTLLPLDKDIGSITAYSKIKKGIVKRLTYADNLPRPVQSLAVDLNNDGLTDYAVCGFGNNTGALFQLRQLPSGKFKKVAIRAVPGATSVIAGDYNHDGWPDLMCLFAQGDEGIWLFLNDHKGGFITKNILRFPPVYGSSSFQLVDMNHDGYPDIIYTAGDNADTSPILKPYHGIYIFINDGLMNFKKKYFYHMNGCTKAIAADFKGTGILDIAAIAFFADKDHPDQGFIYLEQHAPLEFQAHEFPIGHYGKWLTMDVNDYNKDGCPDIALGGFSFANRNARNSDNTNIKSVNSIPVLILQNQFKALK